MNRFDASRILTETSVLTKSKKRTRLLRYRFSSQRNAMAFERICAISSHYPRPEFSDRIWQR